MTLLRSPYFGQAGWFIILTSEKIPSVIERYQKEIIRVFGVLDSVLSKQRWLVADKCSVADLSFTTCVFIPRSRSQWSVYSISSLHRWNDLATTRLVKDFNGFDFEHDFPSVYRCVRAWLSFCAKR